MPIHQYITAAGRVETGQQADQGAFACAGGAYEADHTPFGDMQIDIVQSISVPLSSAGIPEADMLETDLLLQGAGALFRSVLRQRFNFMQFLKDGIHRGQLLLHLQQALHHAVHDGQQAPGHGGQQGQGGAHMGQACILPAQQQHSAQQQGDTYEFQYPRRHGRKDRQYALPLHEALFRRGVLTDEIFLLLADEDVPDAVEARMDELHGILLGVGALLAQFADPASAAAEDPPGGHTGDADHQDPGQRSHATNCHQEGGDYQQLGKSLQTLEKKYPGIGTPVQESDQVADLLACMPKVGRVHISLIQAYAQVPAHHLAITALSPGQQGQHNRFEECRAAKQAEQQGQQQTRVLHGRTQCGQP